MPDKVECTLNVPRLAPLKSSLACIGIQERRDVLTWGLSQNLLRLKERAIRCYRHQRWSSFALGIWHSLGVPATPSCFPKVFRVDFSRVPERDGTRPVLSPGCSAVCRQIRQGGDAKPNWGCHFRHSFRQPSDRASGQDLADPSTTPLRIAFVACRDLLLKQRLCRLSIPKRLASHHTSCTALEVALRGQGF